MIKATFNQTAGGELSRSYSKPLVIEAGAILSLEEEAAPSATTVINCALDVSVVSLFAINSTKDVIVKTNSAGSPDNTFTLLANVPFIWAAPNGAFTDTEDDAVAIDVVTLHVVNAGADAAIISLDVLLDPTP